MLPYRRCIYMTEPLPELAGFPFTIDTASGFYMRKRRQAVDGRHQRNGHPGENLAVDWDWLEAVLERGAARFPFLEHVDELLQLLGGSTQNTPDHTPICWYRAAQLPDAERASAATA